MRKCKPNKPVLPRLLWVLMFRHSNDNPNWDTPCVQKPAYQESRCSDHLILGVMLGSRPGTFSTCGDGRNLICWEVQDL